VHAYTTLLPAPYPSLDIESVVYKLAAAGAGVVIAVAVVVALERCLLVSGVLVPQRKVERIAVSGGACSTR